MLCRGTAYFGDVPIGIGVRRSREGSVSQRAFAPDGRKKYLDFALYGRRSAAGGRESCVLSSAKVRI